MEISRRQFILGSVAAGLLLRHPLLAAANDSYSVSVLGDMHYDVSPVEKYHALAIKKWAENNYKHPARLKEFTRNAKMWEDICKRILQAASQSRRADTAFMLQLGDLVQGDCEDNELHKQMLGEATNLLIQAFPQLPIVTLCGNHDIREGHNNRGAAQAYKEFYLPWQTAQLTGLLPGGVKNTTFGFRKGPDLWIIVDFNNGAKTVATVKKLLEDNPDVRYTFLATHGPVLPMDLWHCRWFYLGEPKNDAARREMRALLAKRNVIVLAGHVHSLELKDWYGDGGRITEMVLNTCAGTSDPKKPFHPAEPKITTEDPAQFGAWLKDEKKPKIVKQLGYVFDEYREGLKRYFVSRAAGHHILHVSDKGVTLDYFGHDALKPTRSFVLR